MNATEAYTSQASQIELAAGVLKQVAQDLRRFHGATSAVERELYLDAYRWVISDDTSWPFSFLNVCQLLKLAPETVRDELMFDQSVGVFSYWARQCRRVAQRLQSFLSHAFTNERNANDAQPSPLVQAVR